MTHRITIAVDAMGGDYAPKEAVLGAIKGSIEHQVHVLLVGQLDAINAELKQLEAGWHFAWSGFL